LRSGGGYTMTPDTGGGGGGPGGGGDAGSVPTAAGGDASLKADRERYAQELQNNPELREKVLRIAHNEQGGSQEGMQAVIESMMNRASVRGTSLAAQAKWTGEGGYYAMGNMGRGMNRGQTEAALAGALGGGNASNYATDNSSQGLAARERASGAFSYRQAIHGETFFSPGSAQRGLIPKWEAWHARVAGGGGSSGGAGATGDFHPAAAAPGAMLAATGGPPEAFIIHHTGGGGDIAGLQATLRGRGLGVEYAMDRQGNIVRIGGPGSANIMPESRYRGSPILGAGHPFLTNRNIVGMEVIAHSDKDVTPQQVEAAKKFIRENYPGTPVFGHGEVNPGHKEADEGLTITRAIRAEREHPALATHPARNILHTHTSAIDRQSAGQMAAMNGRLDIHFNNMPRNTKLAQRGEIFKHIALSQTRSMEHSGAYNAREPNDYAVT
ncbi:MAG: N-acetylmuramoyl-L-alanine amidase, partial [Rhizobiales bacterium]|nr:N-acetylmuramoyl-L-alanine amidase [Hyphomicrobiales bacterium]